jgi:hypothetical protein
MGGLSAGQSQPGCAGRGRVGLEQFEKDLQGNLYKIWNRSTWTISSTCANPTDCVGTLTSDRGWTADIYKKAGMWYVRHVVPDWQPCPDGTAVDGLQLFTFYAGDPMIGQQSPGSDTYLGDDTTTSPSGACSINKQLVVQMPFKMVAA